LLESQEGRNNSYSSMTGKPETGFLSHTCPKFYTLHANKAGTIEIRVGDAHLLQHNKITDFATFDTKIVEYLRYSYMYFT
jgi:hypothetical protein